MRAAARTQNAQAYDSSEGTHPEDGTRGRVLVVDDAKCIRETLVMLFHSMGFRAKAARSGHEGLLMFSQSSYDMVFTDLQMPGMDGWALARHIKNLSPKTPVVLVTGEDEEVVNKRLGASCVDLALFKPFDLPEMKKVILGFEAEMCEESAQIGRA